MKCQTLFSRIKERKKDILKCYQLNFKGFNTAYKCYHIYPNFLDRQALTNSVHLHQMLQHAASDQGLHCLPLIHQFLHTSTGSHHENMPI